MADKSGKMTELSYDHKPDNEGEMARIKAGGGFVDDGRVQGVIAVSRAIGDWEYKNPEMQNKLSQSSGIKKKKTKSKNQDDTPKAS